MTHKRLHRFELLDRAVLDYAHNFLILRQWRRRESLLDNLLVLKLLGRRTAYECPRSATAALRAYVDDARPKSIRKPQEPMAKNLRRLQALLNLDDIDIAVLQLGLAISDTRALRDVAMAAHPGIGSSSFTRVVAAVLGYDPDQIARATGSKGRLARCGLLGVAHSRDLEDRLDPKDGLLDLLTATELTRDRLLEQFLPNVANDDAPWLDHGHLAREIDLGRDLLRAAVIHRAKGINVLLYGDTGTGKTELAKSLAREIGVPLYAARGDGDDGMTRPTQRLSSLLLGLRIVESGGGMVLFDELEDLFERSITSRVFGEVGAITSKDSFNRLLEDNPAPVIWTTNHVRSVDRAFLRRFSHAIEVRPGGVRQRARVLKHHLELPIDLPHAALDALAARYDASPAQAAAAVRAARLIGEPPAAHLAPLLDGTCRLVTGRRVHTPSPEPELYLVDAINASVDVATIADRLASWSQGTQPGVTMCLYGPPGSGKSEYVRYLARHLGRTLIVKRASDLLDCHLGGTEQKIARAFEDASHDDAILVFDEVDSLLQNRRDAVRSWEITQINEMLQQLEVFPGIVACTTNRWDDLDPAVVRRFTFKIELRQPTADQIVRLFWAMFEPMLDEPRTAAADAAVHDAFAVQPPTPGDLAAARRRLVSLGMRPTARQAMNEILAEVGERDARRCGFLISPQTRGGP